VSRLACSKHDKTVEGPSNLAAAAAAAHRQLGRQIETKLGPNLAQPLTRPASSLGTDRRRPWPASWKRRRHWLAGWLAGWLVGWLVGWLAGWLTGGRAAPLAGAQNVAEGFKLDALDQDMAARLPGLRKFGPCVRAARLRGGRPQFGRYANILFTRARPLRAPRFGGQEVEVEVEAEGGQPTKLAPDRLGRLASPWLRWSRAPVWPSGQNK